jgi:hypothetical protein
MEKRMMGMDLGMNESVCLWLWLKVRGVIPLFRWLLSEWGFMVSGFKEQVSVARPQVQCFGEQAVQYNPSLHLRPRPESYRPKILLPLFVRTTEAPPPVGRLHLGQQTG